MFESRVLETAIGLVFLFLGVSLMTTAIQEFLATLTKLRAATLARGLKTMLVQGASGLDFYNKLVTHPVVTPAGKRPSYISAQQFSTAALHLLGGAGKVPAAVTSLRIAAQNLPDSPFNNVINSMFREGEDDLNAVEARLEAWFDQSMDRVSGHYKRVSQYVSLIIGTLIAFGFQVNAIAAVTLLWTQPPISKTLVGAENAAITAGVTPNGDIVKALNTFFSPIWANTSSIHYSWTWFLGCAATAMAVSLGAPFWFDALQSLVNIRGTGAPPQKRSTPTTS